MSNFQNKKSSLFVKMSKNNSPYQKVAITVGVILIYIFANFVPLSGIDQIALKKAFSELSMNNSIIQILNTYTGGANRNNLISPFSLGIVPFINASIFIDLLTSILPFLEKLQTEEGELGRQTIAFYKKILTLFFAIGQSYLLLKYLTPYIYYASFFNYAILTIQLLFGALVMVWLSNLIDNKGIGNGTSIFIFLNIIGSFLNKNIFFEQPINSSFFLQLIILLFLVKFIIVSQTSRTTIDVVSARQLSFLENSETKTFPTKVPKKLVKGKESGLSVKFNQAGIFPIIIASNIIPFLSYYIQIFFPLPLSSVLSNFVYYLLIIGFNYFYTSVFWDPEKIALQLRKSSVSILNVTPGKETVEYLEYVVRSASIAGGIYLCSILFSFDILKQLINGNILNQINVSSLIILVGVSYEIQRTLQGLFKNVLPDSVIK